MKASANKCNAEATNAAHRTTSNISIEHWPIFISYTSGKYELNNILKPFNSDAIKSVTAKLSDSNNIGDLLTTLLCLLMLINIALNIILKKHMNIITGHRYVYKGLISKSLFVPNRWIRFSRSVSLQKSIPILVESRMKVRVRVRMRERESEGES